MRKSGRFFSPHFVGCAQIYHQRWYVRSPRALAEGIVCLATANRETYTFPTVQRTHLPFCVLCVQIKAKKQHLPAHKVFVCHPLLFGKGVCYG